MDERIAILYEHPEWFRPLFAELDRRGIPYEPIHAAGHTFDPGKRESPYALLVNRMSPSAWLRGHGQAIFHTLHYLAHLDDIGAPVLNGYRAFGFEISKARQLGLFARLGLRYPRARVINHPLEAPAAAEGLRFPVLVKPDVGGSGAGIRSFEGPEELARAGTEGTLELGPDRTASPRSSFRQRASASSGSRSSGASSCTPSVSSCFRGASTCVPPTTASFRASPMGFRAGGCPWRPATRPGRP